MSERNTSGSRKNSGASIEIPESPEDLDEWMGKVSEFNKRFEVFLRCAVYLWKNRDALGPNALDSLLASTKSAMQSLCEKCEFTANCHGCNVDVFLKQIDGFGTAN